MKYPVLELWSDEDLEWMEVPNELQDDVAAICARINGDLPLVLSWRSATGERYLFDKRRFLAYKRRAAAAANDAEP